MIPGTLGTLVISAQLEYVKSLPAEAEIELAQMLEMKDITIDKLEEDPNLLSSITREILETVEIRVEEGAPRLVLPLVATRRRTISSGGAGDKGNLEEDELEESSEEESSYHFEAPQDNDAADGTAFTITSLYLLIILHKFYEIYAPRINLLY